MTGVVAGRALIASALIASLWTIGGPAVVHAGAPEWKAGLAKVKVTPEQPVFMSGYASRNKPYEKITADLYVKALVVEDKTGQKAVIVTSDLIGFPSAIAEPICHRIREKTGFKREQILINSSHTHTGPTLSLNPNARDSMTAGDAQRTVEYTKQLQNKVVDVVVQAAGKLEPASLSWGTGVVHFVMNRREFTPTGVILGNNPRGLADRSVPVLRIDSPDGKLRAVLFGTACHGTTLGPQIYEICGDFAGFAQAQLEEKNPSVVALYMLGCAGDANPYPRGSMELSREHGASLAKEVERVLPTKLRPVRGPLKVALDKADLPLQPPPPRAELEKWAKEKGGIRPFIGKQMLAVLDRGDKLPTTYSTPMAVWQFGADLTLVGLPGEVVVDYVTLLEKTLGPNQLWIAAYCNDVFGYLPSARVLSEGGYETRGLYSGGIGLFAPKAEDVVAIKVRELAKMVGRNLPEGK
jgi:hypothetical protein